MPTNPALSTRRQQVNVVGRSGFGKCAAIRINMKHDRTGEHVMSAIDEKSPRINRNVILLGDARNQSEELDKELAMRLQLLSSDEHFRPYRL